MKPMGSDSIDSDTSINQWGKPMGSDSIDSDTSKIRKNHEGAHFTPPLIQINITTEKEVNNN